MMKRASIPEPVLTIIRQIAQRFYRRTFYKGVRYDDLFQEGVIGYLKALQSGDEDRPGWSGYFRMRITGHILDFLRREDNLPQKVRSRLNRMQRDGIEVENPHAFQHRVDVAILYQLPAEIPEAPDVRILDTLITQANLSDLELRILNHLYREGGQQQEIAAQLNVTPAAISHRDKVIIAKLRRALHAIGHACRSRRLQYTRTTHLSR